MGAADGPPRRANEVVQTAAERAALAAVREGTGETDGAFERHGLRVFLIAQRLAERRGVEADREVLLVAGLLHDLGLYDIASHGGVYVTDGKEFAAELLAPHGWSERRLELCMDAIERHHELRSQWSAGVEVELIRRADLVDVSAGLVAFGLPRDWIKGLFAAISRERFYRDVARLLAHAARERPLTLPPIFLR